ncbi:MAG: 1-acyl-sn-glycerol-3-phosphate acyltransferase [Myxococcales bacterium]|nr:1-acyl-sn-glycerol-3-phosphate acyltransferase [Myxococcales bacterium]
MSDVSVDLDPVRKRDHLVSAALWGAGMAWMVPMLGTMTALNATVLPSHRTELLNRLYCRGQIALTGSRWKAVVDPAVDPAQPYMFCQNHTNLFDHVALYDATPHFKQGLELEKHFDIPVYGWFMKARGTIPVRSGKEGQTPEIMQNMRDEIARGHSILAFPEGHRTLDGRVGPFRRGVFFIARDLGIPIAPVAVTGMYRVNRKGSWLIRPGHEVTVYVDAPIPTKGLPDSAIPELAEQVRDAIVARVDAYWQGA